MSKKNPTPKRRDAVERQAAHGESLRSWLQDRATAAKKALAERRKKAAEAAGTRSRGVDRVPKQYRGDGKPKATYLVEHADENHAARRARGLQHGSGMRSGTNQPYTNPARDSKPSARLRTEVR